MLIEFAVQNFRSIRTRQTLSMVASADKDRRSTHVSTQEAPATPALLRSAVIYGANAAGKSNLLTALDLMSDLVSDPTLSSIGKKLPFQPFVFDPEVQAKPTVFEVNFIESNVRYQYGLSYDYERVVSEWLFAFPEGRAQRWFERRIDEEGNQDFEFGGNLRGQKKQWQEATRTNALFLATAAQLNSEQLQPIYNWFHEKLRGITPFARVSEGFTMRSSLQNPERKKQILEFIIQADLGISDFEVSKRKFELTSIPDDVPDALREFVEREMEGKEFEETRFLHRTSTGSEAFLKLEDESGGTSKLFALAGPWIDVLENGYVLLVDELDTSLHPKMMSYLIEMIHNPSLNKKNAQLIFTTHDTNALRLFRRDQIWVMEKNKNLESHITPLSDFSPRKGENIEKGYLEGRFGGTPFIGSLSSDLFEGAP